MVGHQRQYLVSTMNHAEIFFVTMVVVADVPDAAVAVDVEEEERGGGKYVGKLAVVYNPNMVRENVERLERCLVKADRQAA